MKLRPLLQKDKYQKSFQTIESHTMGEPTRIILGGFPDMEGISMMEKKQFLADHYDHYRKALMLEPRGHRDMFGALITDPVHEEADLGVIFMDSSGYLNMCGHGSIGAATVAVETGLVKLKEPYTQVVLDAPSGVVRTRVKVEKGKAVEVSLMNVPSFLYKQDLRISIPGYGRIHYDIAFGGSFFVLVDAQRLNLRLAMDNIEELTTLGMTLIERINQEVCIRHPYLNIGRADLCEFYGRPENPSAHKKNVVIFGGSQADRSPCGTGTSAKLAAMYVKGEIGIKEPFVYESITGSLFCGMVMEETEIGGQKAIIPQITGSAYITGFNDWVLDENDPLAYGFMFGRNH